MVTGLITGQLIKTDTVSATNTIESFELTYNIMALGVEVPSLCYEPQKRKCTCRTSCYFYEKEDNCMLSNKEGGSKGEASGKNRSQACKDAKRNAQAKHPKGCRNKHCQPCKCDSWCK